MNDSQNLGAHANDIARMNSGMVSSLAVQEGPVLAFKVTNYSVALKAMDHAVASGE
ncbi:MAG: hypothetical protein NXI32_01965 [bacterium]|nr:hypothetical protein [bacterium]